MSKILEKQLSEAGNQAQTFSGDKLECVERAYIKSGVRVDVRKLEVTFASGKKGGVMFVDDKILESAGWASAKDRIKRTDRQTKSITSAA